MIAQRKIINIINLKEKVKNMTKNGKIVLIHMYCKRIMNVVHAVSYEKYSGLYICKKNVH